MSCACNPNPPLDVVVVTSTTAGATAYELTTSFVLSTLTANADFILVVDPGILAADTANNPVVLTDGTTDLNLEMYNGNYMRESVFKPLVRRRTRCRESARLRCFYGNDPDHVLVRPTQRY